MYKIKKIQEKLEKMGEENTEKKIDYYELVNLVNNKVYSNQYCCDYDGEKILAAKEIARKYKVRFQDILKLMRPCGMLNRPVWDENGNIVPYKKIFG